MPGICRLSGWTIAAATAVATLTALPGSVGAAAQPQPEAQTQPQDHTPGIECPGWPMYGANLERTFSISCNSPITAKTAHLLVPAWTVNVSAPVTASPGIAGGTVYVGAFDGVMYAIDLHSGEIDWTYQTKPAAGAAFGPIVSSAAVVNATVAGEQRRLVVFGAGPVLYALDAATGAPVWRRDFSGGVEGTALEIESSPVVWRGTVYVGMDTHNHPASDTGGVSGELVALDVATGQVRWKFEPDPGGHGCGGVWGSPLVDNEREQIVFGTANCPSPQHPWSSYTEAVIALDAVSGQPRWSFSPHEPHNARDEDFGATPNLFTDQHGVGVVGIGGKDGRYYMLRSSDGALLRSTKVAAPGHVGENFSIGGFIGSTTVLDDNVYGATALGGPPYYHSINGTTGEIRWRGLQTPSYAPSAGVNDVVVNGALDGVLRAYDAGSGAPLWAWPTLAPISSGPAVAGEYVLVGAGTSTDVCAKGAPGSQVCQRLLHDTLGSIGAVHAFRLAPPGDLGDVIPSASSAGGDGFGILRREMLGPDG